VHRRNPLIYERVWVKNKGLNLEEAAHHARVGGKWRASHGAKSLLDS